MYRKSTISIHGIVHHACRHVYCTTLLMYVLRYMEPLIKATPVDVCTSLYKGHITESQIHKSTPEIIKPSLYRGQNFIPQRWPLYNYIEGVHCIMIFIFNEFYSLAHKN